MAVFSQSILIDVLILLATLVGAVITYFKWKFRYWKSRGVITPKPTIPYGNISEMVKRKLSFGQHFKNMYHEFKAKGLRYFGCYFISEPTLVLLDLDLIKQIMTKDFEYFTNHANYINEEVEPITGHLFGLKGTKWRNLRVKLTPTFTSGKMKMMFQTLVDCSKGFFEIIDRNITEFEPLDIHDIVGRYTTDVIGSCAFGIECNTLKDPNSEFRNKSKRIFQSDKIQAIIRALSISWPFVLDFFKLRFFKQEISDFFTKVVKDTVDYREKNNIIRKDFMHLLIQLKNNVNIKDEEHAGQLNDTKNNMEALTIDQLTAQAFLFFIAGFETSSTTLTFCFYELATNLDIQNKVREEINTVLSNHQENITYDVLMEMTYMDKCIQETLRKYPPIPLLFRECTKTYQIPDSDIIINIGDKVFMPIYGIHNDEEYYPDPHKFDPERFSPENKASRHHYAWLPFGEGPRACLGLRFGLMQTKVALTVLLRSYEFSLNSKTKVPLVFAPNSLVLATKDGIWLNAKRIEG